MCVTCQISCRLVKQLPRYGRFSRWLPSAILNLLYACLDHQRRVFDGFCHCTKFGWNWCSSFTDNMQVLILCALGIKLPIHAILGVWGQEWCKRKLFAVVSR